MSGNRSSGVICLLIGIIIVIFAVYSFWGRYDSIGSIIDSGVFFDIVLLIGAVVGGLMLFISIVSLCTDETEAETAVIDPTWVCEYCGRPNHDNYCYHCGRPAPRKFSSSSLYCAYCGNKLSGYGVHEKQTYCPHCGRPAKFTRNRR